MSWIQVHDKIFVNKVGCITEYSAEHYVRQFRFHIHTKHVILYQFTNI